MTTLKAEEHSKGDSVLHEALSSLIQKGKESESNIYLTSYAEKQEENTDLEPCKQIVREIEEAFNALYVDLLSYFPVVETWQDYSGHYNYRIGYDTKYDNKRLCAFIEDESVKLSTLDKHSNWKIVDIYTPGSTDIIERFRKSIFKCASAVFHYQDSKKHQRYLLGRQEVKNLLLQGKNLI